MADRTMPVAASVAKSFDADTVRDLAIRCTDQLVQMGYVPDCTNTTKTAEFDVQDSLALIIRQFVGLPRAVGDTDDADDADEPNDDDADPMADEVCTTCGDALESGQIGECDDCWTRLRSTR
jgi:hypothetical protein